MVFFACFALRRLVDNHMISDNRVFLLTLQLRCAFVESRIF